VKRIRSATDLVLCVLPFEADFYAEHDVPARFIGHPLADRIPLEPDRAAAREALGFEQDRPLIALLPGSRGAEVSRLGKPFLETARWLADRRPDVRFVVAIANDRVGQLFDAALRLVPLDPAPQCIRGRAREVMAAADVLLSASGTATLEGLLMKRRMVIAHQIAPLTYWIVRKLGVQRLKNFSLPNLLAGRTIVPEFVQDQVRADVLGPSLLDVLEGRGLHTDWYDLCVSIHQQLRRDASEQAASALFDLIGNRSHK